jgi:ribonuclease VapC
LILDTSALVAILYGEPEQVRFAQLLHDAECCRLSVVSLVELAIVIEAQAGPDAARQIDALIRRAGIVVEPVSLEQGALARQAFLDYGKGRHKAGLNFGDCFSYALAKATGEPLLFKGDDFALTDIGRVT